MLQDLTRGRDPQIIAAIRVLVRLDADVVLLTGFDHDHGLAALDAFRAALAQNGLSYPDRFALNPNRGQPTGRDMDHDGRLSRGGDAQGWGRFPGASGMAILSRLPVDPAAARDFSALLWADLPDADLPPDMSKEEAALQRLSSTGHWDVPLLLPDGTAVHLLAWHATPPVFDGSEDRNGRRNHDETAFWSAYLDRRLGIDPPDRFVLLGDANLDPDRGNGRPGALRRLLADPRLTDPLGPQPTARYDPPLGDLRLDYLLPSAGLRVLASGVMRPETQDAALARDLRAASHHWPLWADVSLR